jgi:uncharacterized protein YbjT (DUF2867 family)
MKTAIVLGATGLVGRELVSRLCADDRFDRVVCPVRTPSLPAHPKLIQTTVDFRNPDAWKHLLKGDVLFSAMGTTLRTSGSKDAQWEVDYTFQFNAAREAAGQGVSRLVLVSSAGANPDSRVFYSRMKGMLDDAVSKLSFRYVDIVRPSILAGKRAEFRVGERIGLFLMQILNVVPGLRRYRPVQASVVANAMISASLLERESRLAVHELEEVHRLAAQ